MQGAPTAPTTLWGKLRRIGPGMMVTGAIVGTGTITTLTVAGTEHGYTLLWASVTFAILLVIILQEMVARITLSTGNTLATLVRERSGLWVSIIAVLAIFGGNIVYSVGNLNGVVLAMSSIPADIPPLFWVVLVTLIYWGLLMIGKFHYLEKAMAICVGVISLVFVLDMFVSRPDYAAIGVGLVVPQFTADQIVLVTALIGTAVVPYNLYLHSSAIRERGWHKNAKGFLSMARMDIIFPMFICGLVTMAVGVVAASVLHPQFLEGAVSVDNAEDMSKALEPVLGPLAYVFFNIGLFAAAISSMPMAALSAAYVTTESFGLNTDLKSKPFRAVFSIVSWAPALIFIFLTASPVATIIMAQSINGILLPITAILVLWFSTRKSLMGSLRNKPWMTVVATIAVAFMCFLGIINILRAFGLVAV